MDAPRPSLCIDGHQPFTVCIPDALWSAWCAHREDILHESDLTLGEMFRHALIDYLRSVGTLPPPYNASPLNPDETPF